VELLIDRSRDDLTELRARDLALTERLDTLAVDYAEGNLTGRQ